MLRCTFAAPRPSPTAPGRDVDTTPPVYVSTLGCWMTTCPPLTVVVSAAEIGKQTGRLTYRLLPAPLGDTLPAPSCS